MRALSAFLFVLVACCAGVFVVAKSGASPVSGISVVVSYLPGDTIRYIARWAPATRNANQLAVAGYETSWENAGQVQRAGFVTDPVDSISFVRPGLSAGDSIGPLSVRVRTRDSAGSVSGWRSSLPWFIRSEAEPPSLPGDIQVDTTIIPAVARVIVLPESSQLTQVGETIQLCAIAEYEDGSWGMDPFLPYCQQLLDEYRGVGSLALRQFAFW